MPNHGRLLGRYRLLEPLGSGGMSVVYKGLDTALDREVAVQVLHPHLAGREESRRRLAREARAVARVHHPNILEVFDFSAEDAQEAYLVTEYIRGQTLRQYMEAHPFSPPEVGALVVQSLAGALAQAHEAGVIHRDLKPENVMVREDGVLKVMDFGIAKILDRDDRMTVTGALVGSPAHMAPEIIEGHEATPASDVFSLGTMLYLFATGRLPFSAPNATATLKRILDGYFEDPRHRTPAVSDGLAHLIARCLARQPEARYPDAGALRDALGELLASVGLVRVDEELTTYFLDAEAARAVLVQRLVHVLLEKGEAAVARGAAVEALGPLNQVLALDGGNTRALATLARLHRATRRRNQAALARRVGLGALALGLVGTGVWWAQTPRPVHVETAPHPSPEEREALPRLSTGEAPSPSPGEISPLPQRATSPLPLGEGQGEGIVPPTALPAAGKAAVAQEPTPRPSLVPVTLLVRPFAFIAVDGGARSDEERQQHQLSLTPGSHSVQLSCAYCEDSEERIEVSAGGENVFRLGPQPRASLVSFDFTPAEATVRVGTESRSAAASLEQPFVVRSPKGAPSFQHRVTYEVSAPGFATERREVLLEAGETLTLRGTLSPE